MESKNIPGYENLTQDQQNSFDRIFNKFMMSKGTDARNDLIVNFVDTQEKCFTISTRQWGIKGFMVLDPVNNTWY